MVLIYFKFKILSLSYYRLKQTDYDGKFEYSKIVAVNLENNTHAELLIYPNPTENKIEQATIVFLNLSFFLESCSFLLRSLMHVLLVLILSIYIFCFRTSSFILNGVLVISDVLFKLSVLIGINNHESIRFYIDMLSKMG